MQYNLLWLSLGKWFDKVAHVCALGTREDVDFHLFVSDIIQPFIHKFLTTESTATELFRLSLGSDSFFGSVVSHAAVVVHLFSVVLATLIEADFVFGCFWLLLFLSG